VRSHSVEDGDGNKGSSGRGGEELSSSDTSKAGSGSWLGGGGEGGVGDDSGVQCSWNKGEFKVIYCYKRGNI
jgi:hypothetical protein